MSSVINTRWKFHKNSEEAWEAMLNAIENAKESIELEQYILSPDSIGLRFIDILKRKALLGIKIKILCDEVGSFDLYRSKYPQELIDSGIEFKFFNSIVPWSPTNESLWYFRDHRKLLIIDNKLGFTGGICLSEYMRGWRESHVEIQGEVVSKMLEAFYVMWNKKYRSPSYLMKNPNKNLNDSESEFLYVTNSPLPRKRFIYHELIRAIKRAKKYICITTPYFLPDMRLMRALKKARKRGVAVNLLIPYCPNHLLADIGARTFFTETLESNIKIFRYRYMIHSKTAVVDGIWSTIGSLNLDNISLRYNFEANIISTNKNFTKELEEQFKNDLSLSEELLLKDWRERKLKEKILELLVFPFRKLI